MPRRQQLIVLGRLARHTATSRFLRAAPALCGPSTGDAQDQHSAETQILTYATLLSLYFGELLSRIRAFIKSTAPMASFNSIPTFSMMLRLNEMPKLTSP